MNRTTRPSAPISHFGKVANPFSEISFLIVEAQNERDIKKFLEKISDLLDEWCEFEERTEKLTEAYLSTIVKAFFGEYPIELIPELIDSYSEWLEEAKQLRAEYEHDIDSLLKAYNVKFVNAFSENFSLIIPEVSDVSISN